MLSFNSNSLLPMKKDITELFVFLDDFVKSAGNLLAKNTLQFMQNKPTRRTTITMSEMLTIIILYHQSPCKNFKFFYNSYLQLYKSDLTLVSYERFVILQKRTTIYLMILLHLLCNNSQKTGIYFIDSTSLNVCHGKRISKNKVFKKRSIIETVFDFLKNKFEIEHTRHRSIANFFVHILSILVAYSFKTTKPKIRYNNALSNF